MLDRQVGRTNALEYFAGVDSDLTISLGQGSSVTDEAARRDELAKLVDRRNGVTSRQSDDLIPPAIEKGVSAHQQRTGMLLNEGGERTLEIILAASLKKKNLPTECTRGFLRCRESAPRFPECRESAHR